MINYTTGMKNVLICVVFPDFNIRYKGTGIRLKTDFFIPNTVLKAMKTPLYTSSWPNLAYTSKVICTFGVLG